MASLSPDKKIFCQLVSDGLFSPVYQLVCASGTSGIWLVFSTWHNMTHRADTHFRIIYASGRQNVMGEK